ncbi:ribosomal L7Ae/L30e/S12e/Gadd45 family protein [Candidatus Woesearchaeota archaeon]|nr:ribosomal L7Ae/L30e/S12e/Gadd45 family protein [Candidatus Woesearchaeota archaeon]
MAKENSLAEIKKHLSDKKLVLGTRETIKKMKLGKLEKVFLTSNCPENVKKDVEYYASVSGCKTEKLDIPNEELGVICKKQFAVSLAGLLKQ